MESSELSYILPVKSVVPCYFLRENIYKVSLDFPLSMLLRQATNTMMIIMNSLIYVPQTVLKIYNIRNN